MKSARDIAKETIEDYYRPNELMMFLRIIILNITVGLKELNKCW